MRIGLTFDMRAHGAGGAADDVEEEFDPPETIASIEEALRSLGHEVVRYGDGEEAVRALLAGPRPDLVFNIAEGLGAGRGREARLPAFLELIGVRYSGSDPLGLALTLDKDCAKRVVASAGVPTARWVLVRERAADHAAELAALPLPVIVKPAWEGSSKGILPDSVVEEPRDLAPVIERCLTAYRQPALVEEFIHGDEITVGVLGNRPARVLGMMRVLPRQPRQRFVYDLEVKRDWKRQVEYQCPPRLPAAQLAAVERAALAAFQAMGLCDVARVDFRVRDGVPYFLEANPLPGLSPEYGDLPMIAKAMGVPYRDLIGRILDAAVARTSR